MKQRERFIRALERKSMNGLVPHFELAFFLTMEAFGKVHPLHRNYAQWNQMSKEEQQLHITEIATIYVDTAVKYNHSAIFVHSDLSDYEKTAPVLEKIRELSGNEYFIMMHGDPTYAIPDGENMLDFTAKMYEKPELLKDQSIRRVEEFTSWSRTYEGSGLLDGFALCSDYCFNINPFFGPDQFAEFITPYLKQILAIYRSMGYYSIKHTDGNIMPILEQMVDCNPDAIHSLDPQGGVDLNIVRKKVGDRVCLIGNVNSGLLQTGSEQECIEDVKRSLEDGMKAPGYIFSTSNCVYTGLPLSRYELMQQVWKMFGVYK